jgi:hypothetical protein
MNLPASRPYSTHPAAIETRLRRAGVRKRPTPRPRRLPEDQMRARLWAIEQRVRSLEIQVGLAEVGRG